MARMTLLGEVPRCPMEKDENIFIELAMVDWFGRKTMKSQS